MNANPDATGTAASAPTVATLADIAALRAQFPLLQTSMHDQPLAYLDSGATTQKPEVVLAAIDEYYRNHNANVHRAAYGIADEATRRFEDARARVARYIGADAKQVIWTRGTTEAINLVAATYGRSTLRTGDEILVSELEHHSNIVPWQLVAQQTGAIVKVLPVTPAGELDMAQLPSLLTPRTRIVAVNHISNALGTINPVAELTAAAHAVGAIILVDGAQAMPHLAVDVGALDVDFYAFSGHKMFGPTGIGVLYGRRELLEAMPPYQSGGEMIETVSFTGSTFNRLPYKFEAGTPNIAGAIGLGAAVDFMTQIDLTVLAEHERRLTDRLLSHLRQIDGVRIVGEAQNRACVVSFVVDGGHPNDIGTLLDRQGIAVRTGHHCAMPLMERLSPPGTVRASLALYNSESDVDRLAAGLRKAMTFL